MTITIRHQIENTIHKFEVNDTESLTSIEVWAICHEMNVKAVFVNDKYYKL